MIQVRLDLRLELFADVPGPLDEILDFDETSRDENVAPLQPPPPEPSGSNNDVLASSLPVLVFSPAMKIGPSSTTEGRQISREDV